MFKYLRPNNHSLFSYAIGRAKIDQEKLVQIKVEEVVGLFSDVNECLNLKYELNLIIYKIQFAKNDSPHSMLFCTSKMLYLKIPLVC